MNADAGVQLTDAYADTSGLHQHAVQSVTTMHWPVVVLDACMQIRAASPAAEALLGGDFRGRALPVSDPFALRALAEHASAAPTPLFGRALLSQTDPQAKPTPVECEVWPVARDSQWAMVRLYAPPREIRRTHLLLCATQLLPDMLAAESPPDLVRVLAQALAEYHLTSQIVLLQPDGSLHAVPWALANTSSEAVTPRLPIEAVLYGSLEAERWHVLAPVVEQRRPMLLDTPFLTDSRMLPEHDDTGATGMRQALAPLALLAAPLVVVGRLVGVLLLSGPGLSSEDLPVGLALATQFAGALQQLEQRAHMAGTLSRLELIIQHVPDALLVVRPDLTMHVLNDAPLQALGYRRGEIEGRPLVDLVPHRYHDLLRQRWDAMQRGKTQRFEIELLRRNGSAFMGAVTTGRLPRSDDMLTIITDVTARQQLFQSEKMAALGRLVAGVAHELNNPLAIILGLTQLNLFDSTPSALLDDLRNIEQATLRASKIVQQLTNFVQSNNARPLPVDLIDAIEEVTRQMHIHTERIGAELIVRIDPGLPAVEGDMFQIRQALQNVLQNALQAVERQDDGEPRVVMLRGWREGDWVRVSISDTGAGIAPDLLSRIFEPFFTTRAVGQGIGLGLAIAYTIVQQHGGQIWAESGSVYGTVFHIALPICLAP